MSSWGVPSPPVRTESNQPFVDLRLEDIRAEQRREAHANDEQFRAILAGLNTLQCHSSMLSFELYQLERKLSARIASSDVSSMRCDAALLRRLKVLEAEAVVGRACLWPDFWRSCWHWLKGVLRCR